MEQATLNKEMSDIGRNRYWKKVNDATKKEQETVTPHGQRLMSAAIEPFAEAIEKWISNVETRSAGVRHSVYKFLIQLPPNLIAYLTVKSILDSVSFRKSYSRSARMLGNAIEDEVRFRYLQKKEPHLWRKLRKQLDKSSSYQRKRTIVVLTMNRTEQGFEKWSEADKARIGLVLIDLLRKSTGLVEIQTIRGRKNQTNSYVVPSATTSKWIQDFHECHQLILPFWMPTVDLPVPWHTPCGGGYDPEFFPPNTLVKTPDREFIQMTLSNAEMPEVYSAVNLLQQTPWTINQRLYPVMKHFYDTGVEIARIPSGHDTPLPSKPIDIDTNPNSRKAWKRKATQVYDENVSVRSKRLQMTKIMVLANKFLGEKEFYFPYTLDFRGRTYTIPNFLDPQGTDAARSLLLFANGKEIHHQHEADWLAVYGANLFGFDKVDYTKRIEWVSSHQSDILSVYSDPIQNLWWTEADEPWQFLSWCIEWSRFQERGFGFITHLPVCLDASNNGLQILSLLSRDEVCGQATNCVPTERPADIYQDVADVVLSLMRSDLDSGNTLAAYWINFGIDRKACKRPVMVLPYGGTFYSCQRYIREWFKEEQRGRAPHRELTEEETFELCAYLSKKLWQAIDQCIGRPRRVMQWLQECAKIFVQCGLPIAWTAPTGFPVVQKYYNLNSYKVKTALGERRQAVRLTKEDFTRFDKARQVNGISPNYVHSLDAAALHKTICTAHRFGLTDFAMIHDSYGVLAPDVDVLSASLRRVFVEMFRQDLLSGLRDEWQAQLPEGAGLPPLPDMGLLNPSEILDSEFFFS